MYQLTEDYNNNMRELPKKWIISGLRLKTTRFMLELYLRIMRDQKPNCSHTAVMYMWTHPEVLAQGWSHAFTGSQIHNMRFRITCAYYVHRKEPFEENYNIAHELGMEPMDKFIEYIQLAKDLPASYCGDFYRAKE